MAHILCSSYENRANKFEMMKVEEDQEQQQAWLCDACERAPAAFLCKADAASLCASCDSDIHSANPLARRHHRVPIPSFTGMPVMWPAAGDAEDELFTGDADETVGEEDEDEDEDEDEAASWLLPNGDSQRNDNGATLFGGAMADEYLDLDDYNSSCQFNDQQNNINQHQQHYSIAQKSCGVGDSVVPIQQYHKGKVQVQEHGFEFGLEYEASSFGYSYHASRSHNVSLSPMDVGVVPESTSNEASISHPRAPKGTIDLFSGSHMQMPTQLSPQDREARVLRYREKKKNRKFEKTIRYASRKAYAETRPRIKGRFAKRRDAAAQVEVEQMMSTSLVSEGAYGIVPSF